MIVNCINRLRYGNQFVVPTFVLAHTKTCPAGQTKNVPPSGGGTTASGKLQRAIKSGPVRLAFVPEEWFLFFHRKTGVSGPYVLAIGLGNYLVSKEIFVMEHEYYVGLSIFVMLWYATTNLGGPFAAFLDKEVDAYVNEIEKGRQDEMNMFNMQIKECQDGQRRAQGQKLLMDAKKENIAMQLEAAYRERLMQAFKAVKARMDYQVKYQRAINRIHQKWMIDWIIDQVNKSITPDFEKSVFDSALRQIVDAAGRTN